MFNLLQPIGNAGQRILSLGYLTPETRAGSFKIEDKGKGVINIMIYGYIADEKWFESDVTASEIKNQIDGVKNASQINVFVNTWGGSTFAGIAIHNSLKQHKANVTAFVDGIAASSGSIIIQGAKEIHMPRNSMVMIHNAWTVAVGNADEFRKLADTLDKVNKSVMESYKPRVKVSDEELKELMDEETWMGAEEAVEKGFADVIDEDNEIEATIEDSTATINGRSFDISSYKNFPKDKYPKPAAAAPHQADPPPAPAPPPEPEPPADPGNNDTQVMEALRNQYAINASHLQEVK